MKPHVGLAARTETPSPGIAMGRPVLSIASLDDLVVDGQLEERGATGGASRWTLLVVGLLAAIAGFGYVSREPDAAPPCVAAVPTVLQASVPVATAPSAALRLQLPVEGGAIGGNTVVVRGVAARPLGRVHIAAIVGSTELGAADATVTTAGPFAASVSMIKPAWEVGVELRITAVDAPASTAPLATRALVSEPQQSVGLTRIEARQMAGRMVMTIDGVAGTELRAVQLRLVDADGAELAAATPTLGAAEGWGGVMLAARLFHARLQAEVIAPSTPLYLVLSWRDPVSGNLESASQPMSVPMDSSLPDPMRPARS